MSVYSHSELCTYEVSSPKHASDEEGVGGREMERTPEKGKTFRIPHIAKRRNKIEQNIC
jgi:hypothetical protein